MSNLDTLLSQFQELIGNITNKTVADDNRNLLTSFLEELRNLEDYNFYLNSVANLRKLKPETLKLIGGVMFPEWFDIPYAYEDIAYQLSMLQGRFLIPVKDSIGSVIGVVGYDAVEEPKYLDLKMQGYKAKEFTLLGMENIKEYYSNNEPIFIPEGSMCYAFLREEGFCALSMLGSYLSNYNCRIINRFGERAIIIPDNDQAGDSLKKNLKYKVPKARILKLSSAKDIDDIRKISPEYRQKVVSYLRSCRHLMLGTL